MKKLFYLASLLTVLAGAASCEKNSETSPSLPDETIRTVTIKAGSAQTKTSVSAGTLTWSANDKLNIVPQKGSVAAAALDIQSGVGEATGTFQGMVDASITDATELYGWCGGSWTYNLGTFSVDMPATQTYVANGLAENAYPSIGTGTIEDGITLSNPMGVLILTVKGSSTDLVKSISVTSAANNLAGSFSIDKSTHAVSGGSSNALTLNIASPYVALSSIGANFYIVLPPAEYAANDLTVTVTFSNDSYLNTTFCDAVTVTAGNAAAKEIGSYVLSFPDDNSANNTVNNYTSDWTAKIGKIEWTLSQFNNSNWSGVTCIKAGRKTLEATTTPYIKTNAAFTEAINCVAISYGACSSLDMISNAKLIVASDAGFTENVKEYALTITSKTEVKCNITPTANRYYKISYNCDVGKSNGYLQINKVTYFY